jgi:hypothetical protein
MEELTRVDPSEDPYLALRTALAVAICLLLAEPLGITIPMLPVVMAMSMTSGQRGALTARSFAGPLILPIIAIIFSWLAAVTVNMPFVFTAVNALLMIGGLALMLFRGSRGGMMLTVFPLLMAMMALYSDYALAAMRDSMVLGGLALGVATIVLNILFPPQTSRVHVEVVAPLVTDRPVAALMIRLAVYLPIMLLTFASGDMNLLIVPIMLLFVCAEPSHGMRMNQVVDRGGGTLIGGFICAAVLCLYSLVPQPAVLILSCTAVTYFLIDKMTTGVSRPLRYQYICSTVLVMVLSATSGGSDALEVVLKRVVLTSGAMIGGILLLALLESIFLGEQDGGRSAPVLA